jgi:hypothetical protein
MKIEAVLTYGWPEGPTDSDVFFETVYEKFLERKKDVKEAVKEAEEKAKKAGADGATIEIKAEEAEEEIINAYADPIKKTLGLESSDENETIELYCADKLFRRGHGGSDPIKLLLVGLLGVDSDAKVLCHIDGFAYWYLRSAKNFHFFFPVHKIALNKKNQFETAIEELRKEMIWFERSERRAYGKPSEVYKDVRKLAKRKSARDEWRIIAALLFSGPSTMKQLSGDLGLRYTLAERALQPFLDCSIVKSDSKELRLNTDHHYLGITLYFLRALFGIDPLKS